MVLNYAYLIHFLKNILKMLLILLFYYVNIALFVLYNIHKIMMNGIHLLLKFYKKVVML